MEISIDNATEEGIVKLSPVLVVYAYCYLHADLKGLLQFVTGSTHTIGNIIVNFDSEGNGEAIAASTCGRQLTLLSKIEDQQLFISDIRELGKEISFTML